MNIYDKAKELKANLLKEEKNPLKIALFGQPGSGKSSIINALVGGNVVETGPTTDKTIEAEIVMWNELLLVDLPGYGTTKFPTNDFFKKFEIDKFDLFLCVTSGKFHSADTDFFSELQNNGKICLFIRNKSDAIWDEHKSTDELKNEIITDTRKQIKSDVKLNFTSCKDDIGIKELSENIYNNLDEAQRAKWNKSAKAHSLDFLVKKKSECNKRVYLSAGAAATNALNPLPGVDIGIDIAIIGELFAFLRRAYGLSDENLKAYEVALPAVAPVVNKILKYSTNAGIKALLKNMAKREIIKSASKYVPFVGQAIAASIGFALTRQIGKSFLNDCHEVAENILAENLKME